MPMAARELLLNQWEGRRGRTDLPPILQSAAATEPTLADAWAAERASARSARDTGDLQAEWQHLERAHILSQPMARRHVRTHVAMLGYGFRRRDRGEIVGQV